MLMPKYNSVIMFSVRLLSEQVVAAMFINKIGWPIAKRLAPTTQA